MRILLDECLPARFRRDLPGHDVTTVPRAGWAGVENGALLRFIAESGRFEVFVTVDKNLRHQHDLRALPFAVVVLRAKSNNLVDVRPFAPELLQRVPRLRPGDLVVLVSPPVARS